MGDCVRSLDKDGRVLAMEQLELAWTRIEDCLQ